ncbi:MAG: hypothetical protein K6T30_10150, partial [Alicyclobacillus sp.]|nr:hypothetical protein [Alicyclobacillus sp.]
MEERNAFQRWNRRSLNAYWLAIAIFAVFASAYTKWGHAPGASFVRTVAVPTAILVVVTVALEGLLRTWSKGSPYAVIIGSYVCIFVVGWAVPDLYVVIALLGTPLVLSLVHQRRGVVWLSLLLSYVTFALLLVCVYAPHHDATFGGILVGIGFLVMTTWFTLQVFERIQEMVRIL